MITKVECCGDFERRIEYKNYLIINGVGEYEQGDENKQIYCEDCGHLGSVVGLPDRLRALELSRGFGHGFHDECESYGCFNGECDTDKRLEEHIEHLRKQRFDCPLQESYQPPKNLNTYYYIKQQPMTRGERFKFLGKDKIGYMILKCNCVEIVLVEAGYNKWIHSGEE